jgi:peptidoglycan/LPS O-acetylase OafA/YrhL
VKTTAHAHDRYHALDALRGIAMLLGVVLHAAIPYTKHPVSFWPVQDAHRSNVFDFLLLVIHDFRMQLFFLLAGFFGCLLYSRHGAIGTAKHRLLRVALPLALAFVTIQPLLQAVAVYAASDALRQHPDDPNGPRGFIDLLSTGDTPRDAVLYHFTSGAFLKYMIPVHLWFLWYLLLCFAVMLPLASVGDRLREGSLGRAWDAGFRRLVQSRFRWLVLAAVTWPFLVPMQAAIGPDTPMSWLPPVHLLAYYFLFFTAGWTLYRHRDLLRRFVAGWGMSLAVAFLVVFPVGLSCLVFSKEPEKIRAGSSVPFDGLAMAALALFTWLTIGGLIGLFLRCLSWESRTVRWLADSSYWCYLASLPPIILFQYLVVEWDAVATTKFAVVTAGTAVLLLVTYRYGVRYTWIGRLLNGRRQRAALKISREQQELLASAAA